MLFIKCFSTFLLLTGRIRRQIFDGRYSADIRSDWRLTSKDHNFIGTCDHIISWDHLLSKVRYCDSSRMQYSVVCDVIFIGEIWHESTNWKLLDIANRLSMGKSHFPVKTKMVWKELLAKCGNGVPIEICELGFTPPYYLACSPWKRIPVFNRAVRECGFTLWSVNWISPLHIRCSLWKWISVSNGMRDTRFTLWFVN